MTANERAAAQGIELGAFKPSATLAPGIRVGNTVYMSGQVSQGYKGKLGADVTTEIGQAAARQCAVQLLQAVHHIVGTLDTVRVVKLLGAVNCTPDYTDAHLVINGASELFWEVLGREDRGFHARSALGFAQLPQGYAVEIEAIFEVIE